MDKDYRAVFERKLVHHCTPTLAALKPANMFVCREEPQEPGEPTHEELLADAMDAAREKLAPLGLRMEALARRRTGTLLYVYRPGLVAYVLNQEPVARALRAEGYEPQSLSRCIERLRRRVRGTDLQARLGDTCAFPHEIGFFLGYPYDDVMGFIRNKGENFLCCGCWKVYARERDARDCFCRYKDCTALYEGLYDAGTAIEQLAAVTEDAPAVAALAASMEGLAMVC